MKTMVKKIMVVAMALVMVLETMNPINVEAAAKKRVKLNKTQVDLTITGTTYKPVYPTVTLELNNAKKAVKWSASNKKVATVKNTGKNSAAVTAKKCGTAKITAKSAGKKYVCTVDVDLDQIVGEIPIGMYFCDCGYFRVPYFESCGIRDKDLGAWNAHAGLWLFHADFYAFKIDNIHLFQFMIY